MLEEHAYFSTQEAANQLGVSLRTVQLWVESGVLVAWKTPGGHRRILRSSVQQVISERQKVTGLEQSVSRFRVVIVEDDPDLSELLKLSISQFSEDIEVLQARDGFEGLMLIGQSRPELVITDLNMPGMDGFRMIRAIDSGESATPEFIVITALSPQDIQDKGGLPEGLTVLEKPVSIVRLEFAVSQALRSLRKS
jgi:excisionase family DNA binding protein